MASTPKIDLLLERIAGICCAFPEAKAQKQGDHADFRVRKKVFAYFLNDHHGDGIVSVCIKTERFKNGDLARSSPELFYLPAYIGKRGWGGMRLDRGTIEWSEVENFAETSYWLVAPKTLIAQLDRKA